MKLNQSMDMVRVRLHLVSKSVYPMDAGVNTLISVDQVTAPLASKVQNNQLSKIMAVFKMNRVVNVWS